MKIGIIGASGNIGSRIHAEATTRRHDVTAFTRSGATAKGAMWRDLDVFDLDALGAVVTSVDVVVSAYHPGNSARDIGDALQRAIHVNSSRRSFSRRCAMSPAGSSLH